MATTAGAGRAHDAMNKERLIQVGCCLLLGGTFLYAGLLKLWDPGAFLVDVRSFQLVPDPWAAWLAMGLPWLEVLAALAVLVGVGRAGGLLCLSGMLVAFLAGAGQAWARGLDISCGCFGSKGTTNYYELFARNLLLLAAALCLLFVKRWREARGR